MPSPLFACLFVPCKYINLSMICSSCLPVQIESFRSGSSLFVSFASPFKSVHPKTLSRWISIVLTEGGVDTSQWKSHSVRSAGASHLRSSGLSAKQICNRADWSLCSGTYKRFYERYI